MLKLQPLIHKLLTIALLALCLAASGYAEENGNAVSGVLDMSKYADEQGAPG